MWVVGWGSQCRHTVGGHYCPQQMWFGWPRSSPMALYTDLAQPAEIKSLSGALAHCRPSVDQEVLWQDHQLWISRSFWICDSHSTTGCLADLNQKEERLIKIILMAFVYITASWRSRCLHSLPKNKSTLRDEMESSFCQFCPDPVTWMNKSSQFRSLRVIANSHWALILYFVLSTY